MNLVNLLRWFLFPSCQFRNLWGWFYLCCWCLLFFPRSTNSTLQWCPKTCFVENDDESYKPLCENNWLFIISTGRAGSTTLLHALRAVNDLHLIGETNIIGEMRIIYENYLSESNQIQNVTVLLKLQQLYKLVNCPKQNCPSRLIYGGKEVHLSPSDILFMKDLFPCSRFILNIRRDVEAQSHSAFLKYRSSLEISKKNSYLSHLHSTWLQEVKGTYLIALEDFSSSSFDQILQWIGYHDCHYLSIGQFNMNGTYNSISRPQITGSCRLET